MSNYADTTSEDHCGLMVSEKVGKLAVVFGIVNDEIGNFAGFERSNFGGPVQAAGGVDGGCRQSLGGAHFHLRAGQRHHHPHGSGG